MIKTTLDYISEIFEIEKQMCELNDLLHQTIVEAGKQYEDEEIIYCVQAIESSWFFMTIGQNVESVAMIYSEATKKLMELLEIKIGMA